MRPSQQSQPVPPRSAPRPKAVHLQPSHRRMQHPLTRALGTLALVSAVLLAALTVLAAWADSVKVRSRPSEREER